VIGAKRFVFAESAGWEEVAFEAAAEVVAEFGGSFSAIAEEQADCENEREEQNKRTNEERGIHGMDHWVLLCAGNLLGLRPEKSRKAV
jgi:hypothetical protein